MTDYITNYTVVGSPTIDSNYIASGFSGSDYLQIPETINNSADTWEIGLALKSSEGYQSQHIFGCTNDDNSVIISAENGKIITFLSSGSGFDIASGSGTFEYSTNTKYYVKLEFTGTHYILSASTDGTNWTVSADITSSTKIAQNKTLYLGSCWDRSTHYLRGSIDLKECYMKQNGVEVWRAYAEIPESRGGSVSTSGGAITQGGSTAYVPAQKTYFSDLSNGQTIGGKNNLFSTMYQGTSALYLSSLAAPTGTFDSYANLNHPIYVDNSKGYICGDTPLNDMEFTIDVGGSTQFSAAQLVTSATSYGAITDSEGGTGWYVFTSDLTQTLTPSESGGWIKWVLPKPVRFTANTSRINIRKSVRQSAMDFQMFADEAMTIPLTALTSLNTNTATQQVTVGASLWTSEIYIKFGAHTGNMTLSQISFSAVLLQRYGSISNASKGFVYDSEGDDCYWYPSQQVASLSAEYFRDSPGHIYYTNTNGETSAGLSVGLTPPVGVDGYLQSPYDVYTYTDSSGMQKIAGIYEGVPELEFITPETLMLPDLKYYGNPSSYSADAAGWTSYTGGSYASTQYYVGTKLDTSTDFELHTRFSTSDTSSGAVIVNSNYGLSVYINSSNQFVLAFGNGSLFDFETAGTDTITTYTKYYIKVTKVDTTITLYSSTDDVNWVKQVEGTSSSSTNNDLRLCSSGSLSLNGEMWLSDTYIKRNGVKVWESTKPLLGTHYTVVGSPTITSDYEASGFSDSDYIQLPKLNTPKIGPNDVIVMAFKVTFPATQSESYPCIAYWGDNEHLLYYDGDTVALSYGSGSKIEVTSSTPLAGRTKYIVVALTDSKATLGISSYSGKNMDAFITNWTTFLDQSVEYAGNLKSTFLDRTTPILGVNLDDSIAFDGTIDLKNCAIRIPNRGYLWAAIGDNIFVQTKDANSFGFAGPNEAVTVRGTFHYTPEILKYTVSNYNTQRHISDMFLITADGYPEGVVALDSDNNYLWGVQSSDYNSITFAKYRNTGYSVSHSTGTYQISKTGTKCRVYTDAIMNSAGTQYKHYFFAVPLEDFEDIGPGYEVPYHELSQSITLVTDKPIPIACESTKTLVDPSVLPYSAYYDSVTDTFKKNSMGVGDEAYTCVYVGDYFVEL